MRREGHYLQNVWFKGAWGDEYQYAMLRSEWKATEAVVAATSGAFTDMGFNRGLMGLEPRFSPLPLGSAYTTTLAASSAEIPSLKLSKSQNSVLH